MFSYIFHFCGVHLFVGLPPFDSHTSVAFRSALSVAFASQKLHLARYRGDYAGPTRASCNYSAELQNQMRSDSLLLLFASEKKRGPGQSPDLNKNRRFYL